MKILNAGHVYHLDTYDGQPGEKEMLTFMKRSGKGFQFKNPNASRTCGCGESFAV
jgi:hypothetical protein